MGLLKHLLAGESLSTTVTTVKDAALDIGSAASQAATNYKETHARVPKSYEEYINRPLDEVKNEFEASGFTNITILSKKDIRHGFRGKENRLHNAVAEISVDGHNNFNLIRTFAKDSPIIITVHEYKD